MTRKNDLNRSPKKTCSSCGQKGHIKTNRACPARFDRPPPVPIQPTVTTQRTPAELLGQEIDSSLWVTLLFGRNNVDLFKQLALSDDYIQIPLLTWRNKNRALARRNWHTVDQQTFNLPRFLALWESQGRICQICFKAIRAVSVGHGGSTAHVDHNHRSGEIRGLLCTQCNTMIGLGRENPSNMGRSIAYIYG